MAACSIGAGSELTMFYPATEWDMARSFVCRCNAEGCLGLIAGAGYLSVDILTRYRTGRHILDMIDAGLPRYCCEKAVVTTGY
jgi:hypothetical protein